MCSVCVAYIWNSERNRKTNGNEKHFKMYIHDNSCVCLIKLHHIYNKYMYIETKETNASG